MINDYIMLSPDEVMDRFNLSWKGLTAEEVENRQKQYGLNLIKKRKSKSLIARFFLQLRNWFTILLLVSTFLSFVGGFSQSSLWQLTTIFPIIIVLNAALSLFQEYRAEKAMESLKSYIPEYAKAIRDGKFQQVLVKDLVPGDLIVLQGGDRVPADGRLIEATELWANNVPLTGESEPLQRTAHAEKNQDISYLDALNMVFMSTTIVSGDGKAIIIDTGKNTKFGQIASLTSEIQPELSPLQKEIEKTARFNFLLALTFGGIFFIISQLFLKNPLLASILFFIGVMVSCVPEGLQVTVSSALAISMLKMTKRNVLVKRLSAVQTLGSVSIICTDKTGTITKGEMTAKKIFVSNRMIEITGLGFDIQGDLILNDAGNSRKVKRNEIKALEKLLEISVLCNEAKAEEIHLPQRFNREYQEEESLRGKEKRRIKEYNIIGDPTDGSLLVLALKYGMNLKSLSAQQPLIFKRPFDYMKKRMITVHRYRKHIFQYTKGAPYGIMDICNSVMLNDHIESFTPEIRKEFEARYKELAQMGLRLLGFAYKEIFAKSVYADRITEDNMIFLGLVALQDPPRSEVKDAVLHAKQAGIKVVIITGDSGPTSQAISEEVEITEKGKTEIIRGDKLQDLGQQGIIAKMKQGNIVFARVSPEQKLEVVKALKSTNEIVAVTGDGANDAPSLKEADIGIAMGIGGTDLAREAADMILLNNNFASIVKAIESGRVIYANIRRFIIYVFSHNFAELIPFLLYFLIGIPLPLLVVQVLAIDLFIDVIPSLALSREPPEPGIMREMPRSIKKPLFNSKVFLHSFSIGLIISIGALFGCINIWITYGWHFGETLDINGFVYMKGTTMTFAGIVIAQIGNLLSRRTNKTSIFTKGLFKNRLIFWAILSQISIICLLIYIPWFQSFFKTTALGLQDWTYLIILPLIIIAAEEFRKLLARHYQRGS